MAMEIAILKCQKKITARDLCDATMAGGGREEVGGKRGVIQCMLVSSSQCS